MQIKETDSGRVIELDNGAEQALPALARNALVHVWSKDSERLVLIQQQKAPEEIPAGSGYKKLATLELEADEAAVLDDQKQSMQSFCNQLRDKHIDAGMIFEGVNYQTRQTDRENIAGAALVAMQVQLAGRGQEGDYKWNPEASEDNFEWIASDNSKVKMDAPTVQRFGQAAAAQKQRMIMFCRDLKNQVQTAQSLEQINQIMENAQWPQ